MGKIKSHHNNLIDRIISDSNYVIKEDGTIFNSKTQKELGYIRKKELELRRKAYRYITYKGVKVKIHRIVYRKFIGELEQGYVIHHIDNNGLNNNVNNLQQVSQKTNVYHRFN